VATINGEQTRTTSVIKKTLNPYWNESFDMYVALNALKHSRDLDTDTLQAGQRGERSRGPDL